MDDAASVTRKPPVRDATEPAGRDAAPRLRAEGDALFTAGAYAEAEAVFGRLLAAGHETGWNLFQFARATLRQKRLAEALARLEVATAAPDAVAWAHMEKAQAMEADGASPAEAAAAAAAFTHVAPAGLQAAHYATLARWAHGAFDAQRYQAAGALYDFLVARGEGGGLCRLRQADVLVYLRAPALALDRLAAAELTGDLALWGEAVRARALIALGRDRAALPVLRALVAARPDNRAFLRMLFGVLERLEDRAALADAGALLAGLAEGERVEFLLRAALWREDLSAAAALYAANRDTLPKEAGQAIAAAMHRAVRRGDFATADALYESAGGAAGPPAVVAAIVGACFMRRDWARAEAVLRAAAPARWTAEHAELRLRQIELHCYTLRLDEAAALVAAWQAEEVLPPAASGTVAALLASRGDWAGVIGLLGDRAARGMRLDAKPLLDAAAAAARQTGGYASVIAALDLGLAAAPSTMLKRARHALVAECALRRALEAPAVANAAEAVLLRAPQARAALGEARRLLRRPAQRELDQVYLCADRMYLLGMAVALFSLLRHNPGLGRRAALTVVCGGGELALVEGLCGVIGGAFGTAVRVASAASIGAAAGLRTEWGLFTPGQVLAEAAYWRIFMARALLAGGARGRALYVDSDVVAGPGVAELLETKLGGKALGARPDSDLPEVAEAARRIGVEPGLYFNSGVLLFDLSHDKAAGCLEDAIDVALHRPDMLTFHDQCALNLGFRGEVFALPERFNRFYRAGQARPAGRGAAVVAHYMGRPKPWDGLALGGAATAWLSEFRLLAGLLAPEQVRALLLGALSPADTPAPAYEAEQAA